MVALPTSVTCIDVDFQETAISSTFEYGNGTTFTKDLDSRAR